MLKFVSTNKFKKDLQSCGFVRLKIVIVFNIFFCYTHEDFLHRCLNCDSQMIYLISVI